MDLKKLLGIRKSAKRRKPLAAAQDTHKNVKLSNNTKWRKPRGLQSKMRLNKKGYRKQIQIGYGSPVKVKGMVGEGLKPVVVSSLAQLEGMKENEGVMLSSTLGKRKKLQIVEEAKKKNLKIINLKDAQKFTQDIEKELKERKEKRLSRKKKSESKKDEKKADQKKEAQKEEKKDNNKEESVQEQADPSKQEKKERDKILTTKE